MSAPNLKPPKLFWTALSLALIIASVSIAYYFVIFLPNKQSATIQIQQNESKTAELELETRQACSDEARQKAKEKLEKLIAAGLLSQAEVSEAKKALANGLARKEDIDYYLNQCLIVHGLK